MCLGRESQWEGVSSAEVCVVPGLVLGSPVVESGGFALEVGGCRMEQVCEVTLNWNPLWDRKPVVALEVGVHVVTGAGVGEQASSRARVQDFGWCAVEDAVA